MTGLYPSIVEEWVALLGIRSGPVWRLAQRFRALVEPLVAKHYRLKKFSRFLRRALLKQAEDQYAKWIDLCDTLGDDDRHSIQKHVARLRYKPLISIITPVFNTPERWLRDCLESVVGQLYPYWELCIADDASPQPHCRRIIEDYRSNYPQIKVAYLDKNVNISRASNAALALATGEFIALLDHDDMLAEESLYRVAVELNRHADADIIYTDQDKIDQNGVRYDPYFKPDWNPDLFYSQNFINHLGVYRSSIVKDLGGFRHEYLGSQDYDLALRVIERTSPGGIRHIPHISYHWRAIPGSVALGTEEKDYAHSAALKAIKDHLGRRGTDAEVTSALFGNYCRVVYPVPKDAPKVSIVIPTTGGRLDCLKRCVGGILQATEYRELELILVPNNVVGGAVWSYLDGLRTDSRIKVLPYDKPFNFSDIYNATIPSASGELIGILNDDLEVFSPGWLREMVSHAIRPEIGAVGAMLYYPDGSIQHAGVLLGLCGGVAGHIYQGLPKGSKGYFGRGVLIQDYSAVTAACMVVKRSVFEDVGGFDDRLAVAFNDVDLCLRIGEKGYRILWTPYAELVHAERSTRGQDDSPDTLARFQREIEYMQHRWGETLGRDPCYSPNLSLLSTRCDLTFLPRVPKPWKTHAGASQETEASG